MFLLTVHKDECTKFTKFLQMHKDHHLCPLLCQLQSFNPLTNEDGGGQFSPNTGTQMSPVISWLTGQKITKFYMITATANCNIPKISNSLRNASAKNKSALHKFLLCLF